MDVHIRPATAEDLPAITRVGLAAEGEDPAAVVHVPAVLPHIMRTGTVLAAERGDGIAGFGSSFRRGGVTFLGQMFILPGMQSRGIGQALLRALMPDDGTMRATVASPDPRATSLYVRHGMQPLWPLYSLAAGAADLTLPRGISVKVSPAEPGDPELIRADAGVAGRERPEDHRYWLDQRGGAPLWFERAGRRVGYGYVQAQSRSNDPAWDTGSVRIGPLGAFDTADSLECLLAALASAREQGSRLSVLVPGPHPALPTLLALGFRITEIETFLTSAEPSFVDPRRYIPSGGGLF